MRDAYDILGVPPQASADDIHAAYRRLAKRHHPDVNPGDPNAEARFKEIARAYDVLSDAEKRAALDRDLAAAASAGWDGSSTTESTAPRRYYSSDVGYAAQRDDDLGNYVRELRERREKRTGGWPLALGLWIILCFGNSILRGAETELDGVVVATESVPIPIAHYLFVLGPWGPYHARADKYTIRRPDGRSETFIAGQACSLLTERPRIGALIHKQAWRLSYELNGRVVSDFSTSSVSCVTSVPFDLMIAVGFMAIGLRRRRST